jgi:hypothetical protein
MNARTIAAALAALLVAAAVAWWALSGSPAPAAPSTESTSGAAPAPSTTASSEKSPDPSAPKPAPTPPGEERDGVKSAPETPPAGTTPSKPADPTVPGGRGPGGAGGRGGRGGGGEEGAGAEDGRVAPPGVTESVEEFRRLAVTRALDFDAVFPNKGGWPKEDEGRLERYPTPQAWPKVLGYMETDAKRYRVVAEPSTGIGAKASGGFVLPEPLATTLETSNYVTLVCRKGIAEDGVWVSNSYCTLLCQGDMAGKVFFGSYATGVIDGALSGTVTAKSYCNLVVKGKFTGKIFAESYAMIQLLDGLEGSLDLRGSKVYVKGSVPKATLDGIKGRGTVYVDESDLTPGRQVLGDIVVYVGADSVEKDAKPAK